MSEIKKNTILLKRVFSNYFTCIRFKRKMDNPEKLAKYCKQDKENQNKNTTQYVLEAK